jgi:hypothetical protein
VKNVIDKNSQFENLELRIYTTLGELVFSKEITKDVNTLDLHELQTGIYFYRMMDRTQMVHWGAIGILLTKDNRKLARYSNVTGFFI